jgi:hypothetical protein
MVRNQGPKGLLASKDFAAFQTRIAASSISWVISSGLRN